LPKVLTPAAIKNLHDTAKEEIPKKLDLVLQVLKVDDVVHNTDKKDTVKIKQK
jgi:hypothetical protein